VCHVGITTVCIATGSKNTSTIRMSSKIDNRLRQVGLTLFLFAWKNWATAGRNCAKCYIYIYIYICSLVENLSKIQT